MFFIFIISSLALKNLKLPKFKSSKDNDTILESRNYQDILIKDLQKMKKDLKEPLAVVKNDIKSSLKNFKDEFNKSEKKMKKKMKKVKRLSKIGKMVV